MPRLALAPVLVGALLALTLPAQVTTEYGTVTWSRDLDQTLATAAETARPVFLFFQEVPG